MERYQQPTIELPSSLSFVPLFPRASKTLTINPEAITLNYTNSRNMAIGTQFTRDALSDPVPACLHPTSYTHSVCPYFVVVSQPLLTHTQYTPHEAFEYWGRKMQQSDTMLRASFPLSPFRGWALLCLNDTVLRPPLPTTLSCH